MIWLKDKNFVSSYNIGSIDSQKLNELKQHLKSSNSYDLVGSKIIITNNNVFDEFNDGVLTKYFDTDISRCQYLQKKYKSKYPISLSIIDNVDSEEEIDLKKMIDLFSYEYSCLKKISGYSDSAFKAYLTEKINQDFHFFTYSLLDLLRFEKVSEHDISRIKQIKELSFGVVDTNCDYYLDKVPISEYNSKVLTLAKKLR